MDLPYTVPQDDVVKKLNEKKAKGACGCCGCNDWFLIKEAGAISQWSNKAPSPSIPVAVFVCNNCGNIRMHSLGALGVLPVEKGEAKK